MAESFHDPELRPDPTHPAIKGLALIMAIAFFLVFGLPYIYTIASPQRPHDVPSTVKHGPRPDRFPSRGIDHEAFHGTRPPA